MKHSLCSDSCRYVKSRSDSQLRGTGDNLSSTSDCDPQQVLQADTSKLIMPCGLIAWSYFNDTYAVRRLGYQAVNMCGTRCCMHMLQGTCNGYFQNAQGITCCFHMAPLVDAFALLHAPAWPTSCVACAYQTASCVHHIIACFLHLLILLQKMQAFSIHMCCLSCQSTLSVSAA